MISSWIAELIVLSGRLNPAGENHHPHHHHDQHHHHYHHLIPKYTHNQTRIDCSIKSFAVLHRSIHHRTLKLHYHAATAPNNRGCSTSYNFTLRGGEDPRTCELLTAGSRSNVTVPEISLSSDRRINRDTPISEPSLLQHRSCPPLAPSHCGDLRRDLCQRDEQARTLLRILKRGCFFHLLTTFQVSYQSFVSRTS